MAPGVTWPVGVDRTPARASSTPMEARLEVNPPLLFAMGVTARLAAVRASAGAQVGIRPGTVEAADDGS